MAQAASDTATDATLRSRFRFERKFLLEEISVHQTLWRIKSHPALFRELYFERQVNNIYLDTYDFKNYHDNVVGSAERLKARIRWYGDLERKPDNAQLELKTKQGLLGEKRSWEVPGFSLDAGLDQAGLQELLRTADLPATIRLNLGQLRPALVNSYRRRYFLSVDGLFRITLDTALEYYSPQKPRAGSGRLSGHSIDRRHHILELKYDQSTDEWASEISSFFPFRLTKSSKYVSGLALVNQWSD